MQTDLPNEGAASELDSTNSRGLTQIMALVGSAYLFLILCDPRFGIANLSIRFMLKDGLHLGATELAGFMAIITFAWYCKPVAGLLTDNISLFGFRRKGYLILSSAAAGALWIALIVLPRTYGWLIWSLALLNVGLVIAQTTMGGMLVETGQDYRATGRVSAIRLGSENLGLVLAGVVGGWFAARYAGYGFMTCGAFMLVMAVMCVVILREKKIDRTGAILRTSWSHLRSLFTSRMMWVAAFFWMLVRFSPGFQTPLFFYQTDVLKLSPEFIGLLVSVNSGAGLLGSIAYVWMCGKFPLKMLLYLGVTLNVLTGLCYFAYHTPTAAIVVEGLYGLGTMMAFLPILDLLTRATPKGSEALGYALIFSFGNISLSVSDVAGSKLFEQLGHSFVPMIWVNSASTALVLVAIPFLPKVLVAHQDGYLPGAAEAKTEIS